MAGLGVHAEHIIDGIAVVLTAAAIVAAVRWVRRSISIREDALKEERARGQRLEHRQGHVLRWAKTVGRHVGIPFPLPDDEDLDEWDEGLK